MKKALTILLALAMLLSVLAGCGSGTDNPGGESESVNPGNTGAVSSADPVDTTPDYTEITDLVFATTNELTTFNVYYAASPRNFKILDNFVDPLMQVDSHGSLIPCLAEDYSVSDDGLTYTFKIREGATWVDYQGNYKADVVAEDWLWGLEWVLNFWKNDSYNTTMATGIVEGAQEYLDYTANLDESEAMALELDTFQEMVGIEAPDDHTLVYHLAQPTAYFTAVTTAPTYFPLSKGQLDEVGVENFRAVTYDALWYCGPYTVTSFVENNEKIMTANPSYWDTSAKLFNTVTYKIVESTEVAYQLYQNGEIDEMATTLSASTVSSIVNDPTNPYHDYLVLSAPSSVVMHMYFNFARNNLDGTPDTNWNLAVANEAFRQCFYSGVDYTNYIASCFSTLNPLAVQSFTVTANNLTTFSDGSDYAARVRELIGLELTTDEYDRYDADALAANKATAMQELTAQGVTFPVTVELWGDSSQTTVDQLTVMKEALEDYLGTDFVTVNINTYITSFRQEVITPSYASVILDGYGAEYTDPLSVLEMSCTDIGDNADFSVLFGNALSASSQEVIDLYAEYTQMVRDADAIVGDTDARLEGLAEAEAFLLEHALIVPFRSNNGYTLTHTNPYSKPSNTNDFQGTRWINWQTNADGWTTAEIEAFREAYLAGN